jgi:hypothetical protein
MTGYTLNYAMTFPVHHSLAESCIHVVLGILTAVNEQICEVRGPQGGDRHHVGELLRICTA